MGFTLAEQRSDFRGTIEIDVMIYEFWRKGIVFSHIFCTFVAVMVGVLPSDMLLFK